MITNKNVNFLVIYMEKMKLDLYCSPHTKINSERIKALNIRATTMKLLEKTGGKFHDTGLGSDFLAMTLKTQATREKNR